MLYVKFVERLSELTGVSEDDVRKLLQALPDVVMECPEGEQIRTYLGVFRIVRRKRKRVKDFRGRWTWSPERLEARIRPGKRLQQVIDPDASGSSTVSEPSESDEDPTV